MPHIWTLEDWPNDDGPDDNEVLVLLGGGRLDAPGWRELPVPIRQRLVRWLLRKPVVRVYIKRECSA